MAGLSAYLKARAYNTSTYGDLWGAMEAAVGKPIKVRNAVWEFRVIASVFAPLRAYNRYPTAELVAAPKISTHYATQAMMNTWTLRRGYPIVVVDAPPPAKTSSDAATPKGAPSHNGSGSVTCRCECQACCPCAQEPMY